VKGHRQEWTEAVSHIGGVARGWAALPWCEATSWPHSVSSLVLWKLREISGRLALLSSNSENISCVTFLKQKKIAENRELALWRLVNRLVPENA
jgi:hypothetical protein